MLMFNDRGSRAVSLIHNERTKLTATMFNTLAAALLAAGVFAPAAAAVYGISDLRIGTVYVFGLIVVFVAGAATLHWVGRLQLGRLQE